MQPGSLFVSYPGKNANAVRAVSERIIAHGFDIWFAEYRIPVAIYLREDIDILREIDAGIDQCGMALLFTNDAWAQSRYCLLEFRRIMPGLGSKKVVQIKIDQVAPLQPDAKLVEELGIADDLKHIDKLETHVVQSGRLDDLLQLLAKMLGKPINPHLPFQDWGEERMLTTAENAKVSMRLHGLKSLPRERGKTTPFEFWRQEMNSFYGAAYNFGRTLAGKPMRLLVNINANRTVLSPFPLAYKNDRQLYRRMAAAARNWYGEKGYGEKGLHFYLFPKRNDLAEDGQIAFTFQVKIEKHVIEWHRLYVLAIRDLISGTYGELDLSFCIRYTGEEQDQAFQHFCSQTPFFDTVAASFRYLGQQGRDLIGQAAFRRQGPLRWKRLWYQLRKPKIAKLKRQKNEPALIWALGVSDEGYVADAIDAWLELKLPIHSLVKVLGNDKEGWPRRKNAALVLGFSRDPLTLRPLVKALDSDNLNVRQGAIIGLGHSGNKEALPHLISFLLKRKSTLFTKAIAVEAILRLGRDESLPALRSLVKELSGYYEELAQGLLPKGLRVEASRVIGFARQKLAYSALEDAVLTQVLDRLDEFVAGLLHRVSETFGEQVSETIYPQLAASRSRTRR